IADSGRVETVYNVEVDEHHTYFVGREEWGFSVWAHNADCVLVRHDDGMIDLVDAATRKVYASGTEAEVRAFARDPHNSHTILGFEAGSGRTLPQAQGGDGTVLKSRIGDVPKLKREAEAAARSEKVRADLDQLQQLLASGHRNPGLSNKSLPDLGITYSRGRKGGRLYWRPGANDNVIEILAKSAKSNQDAVIRALTENYGDS
ncbi:MAG: hypothetical protein K2V38_03305, partial [Gemmataceae bacterium]|nr:hypothetical protein [Gemmataceae bacterium]